jgi:hypothetical protein
MKNLFPTIESVIQHSKPIYLIQLLTIKGCDGVRFQVIYIQNIHTFKIDYYDMSKYPIKTEDVSIMITTFLKTLTNIIYTDITFVMLKTSPLSNQKFML